MRKWCSTKRLGSLAARPGRRGAFTLVELIVSVAILVLMLGLAAQVFSLTSKSTGQATSLIYVSQSLRSFERIIREDLRYIQQGSSMILIKASPINAYWTAEGQSADDDGNPSSGYPHLLDPERQSVLGNGVLDPPRADVLMLFAAHETQSTTNPGVHSRAQQIVYGHAELGEYVPGVDQDYDFEPNDVDPFFAFPDWPEVWAVPASQWHLGRRSVVLSEVAPPLDPATGNPTWANALDQDDPDELSVLKSGVDVVGSFAYERLVLRPLPKYLGNPPAFPWFLPRVFDDGAIPFKRSKLDVTPPAHYAQRLGHYFLPNCASFKVEWALDPNSEFVGGRLDGEREVYWVDQGDLGADPADPDDDDPFARLERAIDQVGEGDDDDRLERLESLLHYDRLGDPGGIRRSLAFRYGEFWNAGNPWPPIEAGTQARIAAFVSNWRSNSDELIEAPVFPAALRITIDVFDGKGRLGRPVRHVMVIPVGQ